MDLTRLLLRMAQIARRRPPLRVLVTVLIVIGIATLIFGIEAAGFWPSWAEAERITRPGIGMSRP